MEIANRNKLIHGWLKKIESNLERFVSEGNLSDADKIEFITAQYHLIFLVYRVLNNQVIMVGAPPVEMIEA
jgi:hypothetical protein